MDNRESVSPLILVSTRVPGRSSISSPLGTSPHVQKLYSVFLTYFYTRNHPPPLPFFQLPSFPSLHLSLSVSLFLPFKFVTTFVKVGRWRIRLPYSAADMDNLMAACRTKYLILLGCPDSATHPPPTGCLSEWFMYAARPYLRAVFGWKTRKCECDVLDVFLILLRRRQRLFVLSTIHLYRKMNRWDCNFIHFRGLKKLCEISEKLIEGGDALMRKLILSNINIHNV